MFLFNFYILLILISIYLQYISCLNKVRDYTYDQIHQLQNKEELIIINSILYNISQSSDIYIQQLVSSIEIPIITDNLHEISIDGYPIVGYVSRHIAFYELNLVELQNMKLNHHYQYNGKKYHSSILISILNDIYDVSYGGYEFYCENCGYHMFAFQEVSNALAKQSTLIEDIGFINKKLKDEEETNLQSWIEVYKNKYPIVGRIVDENTNEL